MVGIQYIFVEWMTQIVFRWIREIPLQNLSTQNFREAMILKKTKIDLDEEVA